jgi:hypothetical protein
LVLFVLWSSGAAGLAVAAGHRGCTTAGTTAATAASTALTGRAWRPIGEDSASGGIPRGDGYLFPTLFVVEVLIVIEVFSAFHDHGLFDLGRFRTFIA